MLASANQIVARRLCLQRIGQELCKTAAVPEKSYSLHGTLYLSKSGWLLLSVPNSLVRGAFDALHEPGIELPAKDGKLNAHISVCDADEVAEMGGPDAITERGHSFAYTLGPVRHVNPSTWDGVGRVWYITVDSPELRDFRRSYGLTPLRKGYDHHITIAVRRTNVLRNGPVKKQSDSILDNPSFVPGVPSAMLPDGTFTGIRHFSPEESQNLFQTPSYINAPPAAAMHQAPRKSQLALDVKNPFFAAEARQNLRQRLREFLTASLAPSPLTTGGNPAVGMP